MRLLPHTAFQGPAFLARDCPRVRIPFAFARYSSKHSCRTGLATTRDAFPLPPFALWPAFPTSDYYGGTDATQVSLPDCRGHPFQGGLPRSRGRTLRGSLGGGFHHDPTALCGSRPAAG